MDFNKLYQNYLEKHKVCDDKRKELQNRIEQRKAQIERLNKRLGKLGYISWVNELLEPIAKAMVKRMPDRYYDILGPFGMTSETSIHFYKEGIEKKQLFNGDNCKSITFRPTDLDKGEISLVDQTQNTERYAEGTLGDINGMNYPTVPMKKSIDELLAFMNRKETVLV